MSTKSINQLREWFKAHQVSLASGEKLLTITEIARRAGCHRDTIYALLAGDRISGPMQHALSITICRVEQEYKPSAKTRLLNIQFSSTGPKLGFGIGARPLLDTRR